MTISPRRLSDEMLDTATTKKDCGLYLFEDFLSPEEADEAFDVLVDDAKFPWGTESELGGQSPTQNSSEHDLVEFAKSEKLKRGRRKDVENYKGMCKLGEICAKIEQNFDLKVSFVFCNRFQNRDHRVNWERHGYGEHICVLTLGSKRRVEFRNRITKQIEAVTPSAGDLYVMPLELNDTHSHRVISVDKTDKDETNIDDRLSFVFFFEVPEDAEKLEKSKKKKVIGFMKRLYPEVYLRQTRKSKTKKKLEPKNDA